jgi:nucleoside-diphosphate-sugar epimerase
MIIDLVEKHDENLLNIVTSKYLSFPMLTEIFKKNILFRIIDRRPNTYTFTKSLAESVVVDYSKDLPCVILRPSIGTVFFI